MSNETNHDDVVEDSFDESEEAAGPAVVVQTFEPFSLTRERFLVAHMNVRTEKHGDERKPALDLKFEATMANAVLLKLHPGLRDALYVPDAQRDIENDYGRKLRFPMMGAIPYDLEIPRTKLRIHDVDSEDNDLVLIDGKTNKFKIMPKEGGSVTISFRVQFSQPDEDAIAALSRVLQQTVPISLACEAAEEKMDNFQQAEQAGKEPMSEARAKAEAQFKGPGETDSRQQDILTPEAVIASAPPPEAAAAAQQTSNVTAISGERKKRVAGGGAGAVE